MSNNNNTATDKLLKFLTFAVLAGCATVITYVMTTQGPVP